MVWIFICRFQKMNFVCVHQSWSLDWTYAHQVRMTGRLASELHYCSEAKCEHRCSLWALLLWWKKVVGSVFDLITWQHDYSIFYNHFLCILFNFFFLCPLLLIFVENNKKVYLIAYPTLNYPQILSRQELGALTSLPALLTRLSVCLVWDWGVSFYSIYFWMTQYTDCQHLAEQSYKM